MAATCSNHVSIVYLLFQQLLVFTGCKDGYRYRTPFISSIIEHHHIFGPWAKHYFTRIPAVSAEDGTGFFLVV